MSWDYVRAGSMPEAFDAFLGAQNARWIAGGTDLLVHQRAGTPVPTRLVSLRLVPGLVGITGPGRLHIGAMTTIADVARSAVLKEVAPALAAAARAIGSMQIRNVATIGGNLCNAAPCADTAPALLVADAIVEIMGPQGAREVALDSFFVGPGATVLDAPEVVTGIRLGAWQTGRREVFMKKGRVAMDIAVASVAISLDLGADGTCTRARLAAGSVAPMPLRLRAAEAEIIGRRIDEGVIRKAGEAAGAEVAPISDVRGSESYRRSLIRAFVRRGLAASCGGTLP